MEQPVGGTKAVVHLKIMRLRDFFIKYNNNIMVVVPECSEKENAGKYTEKGIVIYGRYG